MSAHSDAFKAMLTSNMQEAATGIVDMKHVNVKTMEAFIEYLHLESVHNLAEVAYELFDLADEYQMAELKVNTTNYHL